MFIIRYNYLILNDMEYPIFLQKNYKMSQLINN